VLIVKILSLTINQIETFVIVMLCFAGNFIFVE